MEALLDWTSGISWSLAYGIAIVLGMKKKSYGIPALCICLNFNWELLAVIARMMNGSELDSGFASQILWLVFDVGVLYTWLRYDKERSTVKKLMLFTGTAAVIALATVGANQWALTAFLMNMTMSAAFLFQWDAQVFPCRSIAVLKCLGTLPATILNGMIYRDFWILTIGGLCFLMDVYYVYEIWRDRCDVCSSTSE